MFPVQSRMAMDILSVQATSVASESTFSTSGRVLSIRRIRLTPTSLEMCMCLKDHLDAQERKQDKPTLETPVDFEEEILDAEVQENKAIPLSDEEIALDAASSEATPIPTLIFSVNNWMLKKDQPEGPPFTPHMMAICTANGPKEFQAPASTLQTEESAPIFGPLSKEAFEAPKGQSKKKKKSTTANDKYLSQPSASTLVIAEMHKEAQQATSGQTSLEVTGEVRSDPQLNIVVLASTTEPIFTTSTILHSESDTEADAPVFSDDEEIKMEDLTELVQKTTASFMDLESPENEEPIQVSSEDEAAMETETKDTSSQTIKLEEEKPADEAKAANLKAQLSIQISFIPTDLKELPTKFEAVNGTMDDNGAEYVEKLEIDVPADLKGILDKLVELQTSISALTTRVFDAIPDIMNKVATSLNKFADAISSVSHKAENSSVPSAGQADTHPAEREKITNQATITQLFQRRQAKDPTNMNKQPTQMRG
ncbi:zinc finger BED domain-containing protein RICESLEEPER 2 [Tanacetum coccineum]